jgi:hypothetical protein
VWRRAVEHVLARSTGEPIGSDLTITLNFHPDRSAGGVPILDALRRDGRYRSQFETGTSNGGLTAHPGGDRWRWESGIFGGVYDTAPPADRPTYGAVNHRRRPAGGIVECRLTLAVEGFLDARIIGEAAGADRYDPQVLKRVWHYVARFGRPVEDARPSPTDPARISR